MDCSELENDNLNKIIGELSKIIPSDFLAHEFALEYTKSKYRLQWYNSRITAGTSCNNPLLDFRTKNEKAEDTLYIMCHKLMNIGNSTLYDFILFLIKSYCRIRKEKLHVKELRKSLRSIGISDFSQLNQYAEKESFIDLISNISDWDGIDEAITKIKENSSMADSEIEYQNIGNSCRNLVISVAQIVFNPDIHG